jgi:hypothetical protein
MYKVAASWAYKPAEYNLGVMYFKGQGVPVDRARGAAWMVLAAERGKPLYVETRDLMVTALTEAQFERTDQIWGELKKTYGDEVALRHAKGRWAWARGRETGTRTGGLAGELYVGMSAPHGSVDTGFTSKQGALVLPVTTSWTDLLDPLSTEDGSAAYQQFRKSDNPYDPIFLKPRSGTATVEPLQQVKPSAKRTAEPAESSSSGGIPLLRR